MWGSCLAATSQHLKKLCLNPINIKIILFPTPSSICTFKSTLNMGPPTPKSQHHLQHFIVRGGRFCGSRNGIFAQHFQLAPGKLNAKELVEVVKKVGYKTTWGTHYGLDLIFSWTLPIGSMGRLYIYLHDYMNHWNLMLNLGKYAIVPWILVIEIWWTSFKDYCTE